jgi:hypothetical protein
MEFVHPIHRGETAMDGAPGFWWRPAAGCFHGVNEDSGWLTASSEEVGEECAALFGEDAGGDFDFVVELGVIHDGED